MRKPILLLFSFLVSLPMSSQTPSSEVLKTAQRVNDYFMNKCQDPTRPTFVNRERPSNLWTRAVYYEGLMALHVIDPSPRYIDYTDRWANFHHWTPRNGVLTTDADDQCCAQTYLTRNAQAKDSNPTTNEKIHPTLTNLNHQIATGRHDYWTWIDAIQMAMPLYFQTYQATGRREYADYAMQAYRWTRDECGGGLFNRASGLWWRDKDFVPPYKETDGNDCYWSRGNGWVYAALVRVMSLLNAQDPYYKELKKDYLKMSKAIAACQRADGFWNVSLISPTTYGGKESSGTSLFLYGLSWGVRNGVLKASIYRSACDKAWMGMAQEAVHQTGFLGYVQGTGKQPGDAQPVTYDKAPDFEDFGVGCFLLGATEYHHLLETKESMLKKRTEWK